MYFVVLSTIKRVLPPFKGAILVVFPIITDTFISFRYYDEGKVFEKLAGTSSASVVTKAKNTLCSV